MKHSRGDVEQGTESRLRLRQEISKTTKQPIMSALLEPNGDAQRFRAYIQGWRDPKSCSQNSGSLAKEALGEVCTSREKNRDGDEAGREDSSAEMGQGGYG